ncbi:MAG: hypothetical protein E6K81_08665 [Candidatus Eisenbacteria bacterium]|uniref:Uncharacterized protein n=1 Tax=Eiseniibacteriota bacterium TaxID=2212470 RepID=A0A538U7X2_UNCEI|nr:MAG: hypothetical protein E6K81_08665 [Candidatus Eisenbacteria bacterium]
MSDNRYPKVLQLALLIASLAIAAPAVAQVTYIPIAGLPTEDVDMVELVPTPFAQPPTMIYPTETAIYYINMITDAVYATVPKPGPNISGADYVASPDGTIGVMPILGALCVFTHGPGAPALFMTIPLPGTPARRDIDLTIVPGLGAEPWDALYATGTEVHRINLSTGAIFWTAPLPTPIVEAVDPLYVPASNLVFAATDGFMSEFNATTGAPVPGSPFATGTTLTREVDIRLNPAGTLVYMPGTAVLQRFSAATGAFIGSVALGSPCIEGNDIAWDNTGTRGALPTLANMVWFDAATGAITTLNSFAPYGHQRNMDVIFTAPGIVPQQAGYQAQGAFFTYTVPALPGGIGVIGVAPLPSPTMDGVDPLTSDATPSPAFPAGPVGVIALAPTQGFVTEVDLRTGAALPPVTLVPGVLRMDVDVRKGGTFGNKDYQPYIGGVASITGFAPNQYTITVSTGVHRLDVSTNALIPGDFIPTGMIFRGGDEQVSTLLGPPAPGYTTDDPDQDFVSKCWDYKYAMNRWPMWYSISNPIWYPQFMPYGAFGPPALLGWDIWNDWKGVVCNNQTVILLNRKGITQQTINLPALPIGGLVWDWDNKICKLRLRNQQECIINLNSVYLTGLATVTFVPYTTFVEWYPIVDRMNGWEFVVQRGARRIWCYDHLNISFVTYIDLPARIIRPPVFDEQRKTLCGALANRQVFFFNAHIYRQTLSVASALYYTPVLPAMCVADPVFDIFNHYTLLHLYGGNIAVCDNANGNLLYQTGILPYWPIGPIQVDCFNKIAKWYAYNGASYVEYWMNLYPLRYSLPPTLRSLSLAGVPFGYPQFDSRDGWEFIRIGNIIRADLRVGRPARGQLLHRPDQQVRPVRHQHEPDPVDESVPVHPGTRRGRELDRLARGVHPHPGDPLPPAAPSGGGPVQQRGGGGDQHADRERRDDSFRPSTVPTADLRAPLHRPLRVAVLPARPRRDGGPQPVAPEPGGFTDHARRADGGGDQRGGQLQRATAHQCRADHADAASGG